MSERWVLAKAAIPSAGSTVVCIPAAVAVANGWLIHAEVRGPGEASPTSNPVATIDQPSEDGSSTEGKSEAVAAPAETTASDEVGGSPPDAPLVEAPATVEAPDGPRPAEGVSGVG